MKVYNLTDVATKVLVAQHLVNQHIVVGKELVSPGGSAEVEDTPHLRANLEHLLAVGAVSLEKMPPPYAHAKSKPGLTSNVAQPAEEPAPPAPLPSREFEALSSEPEPVPEPEPDQSNRKKKNK